MGSPVAMVGKRAPDFDLPCTHVPGSGRRRAALADYSDRWLILLFYPRDFSLVCPTELTAVSGRFEEFRGRGCDILGISTDSVETHQRWMETSQGQGGLGHLEFPLASDEDGAVSRSYGVYLEPQHIALRGLFVIDPNGILQYQAVHNLSVGRRSEEIVRVLAALESGGMCPEDWRADCPTLDPTEVLAPGRMLSHYRIDAEVGRGTFGCVYRAHDTTLDRVVAVKVFSPDQLSTPVAVLAEARAAAALNHPNVCTVFGVDDSEGVPFIAMEYVDGRPLSAVLDEGPMPADAVRRLGRQIALAMAAAHGMRIVHGDLKPANILLTGDGVAKITDFGLSRRVEYLPGDDETEVWSPADTGKIAGTPSYMSPEQTRGESITQESDVFSMGVLLYEMLAGQKIFTGEHVLQVLEEIRNVVPNRYADELPEPFADILRRALVADPANRGITMEEIAQMLE